MTAEPCTEEFICLLCFSCRRTNTETMQLLSLYTETKGKRDSAGCTRGKQTNTKTKHIKTRE